MANIYFLRVVFFSSSLVSTHMRNVPLDPLNLIKVLFPRTASLFTFPRLKLSGPRGAPEPLHVLKSSPNRVIW